MLIIHKVIVSVSVVLLIGLQGCLAHAEEPGASVEYLFVDDFSEDVPRATPAKWKVYASAGYVTVVSDATTGRAMRITSDPEPSEYIRQRQRLQNPWLGRPGS